MYVIVATNVSYIVKWMKRTQTTDTSSWLCCFLYLDSEHFDISSNVSEIDRFALANVIELHIVYHQILFPLL